MLVFSVVVAGIGRTVSYFKLQDLADLNFSCQQSLRPPPSNQSSDLLSVLLINLLANSYPQSTTTGSYSGPPSSPPSACLAPASPHYALSSAAYHPSPSSALSAVKSVFTPCALPKVPPKIHSEVPATRQVTPDLQAIRTKDLRTRVKRRKASVSSRITSPVWNWRTGIERRRLGMARGTVSTLIKTPISALRTWCDFSDSPVR